MSNDYAYRATFWGYVGSLRNPAIFSRDMDKTYTAQYSPAPNTTSARCGTYPPGNEARRMLNRHIFRPGSTNVRARYRKAEYEMQLKQMFKSSDGWSRI